ncbi:MAG: hypothetical protein JNM99_17275 [Verrucomicrobiaceae bacterium]|nr:hypothetical protein [Verrucomicrobiaceae bacterium]
MATPLADLDEIILQCRNVQSRELLREAVTCYKANAFRSAIINTWIAVVFDLIEKLRELSVGGDAEAATMVKRFETAQDTRDMPEALKLERSLLTSCHEKFDLFSKMELIDLERLFEDRNRCAHPNLVKMGEPYLPSAELARSHLRMAIETVLRFPPKVGKAALEELFQLVQAEYFPTTVSEAKAVLQESPAIRAKSNVIRDFVLGMSSKILSGDLSQKEVNKRLSALKAMWEIHPSELATLAKTHFSKVFQKAKDGGLKHLLVMLCLMPDLELAVTEGVAAPIRKLIKSVPDEDLALVVRAAIKTSRFNDDAKAKIASLDRDDLSKFVENPPDELLDFILDRATALYETSVSYDDANSNSRKLIKPLLKHFKQPKITKLFEIRATNSQVEGSYDSADLIREIKKQVLIPLEDFNAEMLKRGWKEFVDTPETTEPETDV